MRCVLLLVLVACGTESYRDAVDDPQLPPRGMTDLAPWLAAGYYLGWHCEPAGHPARPPSPHPRNRVCSNDLIEATTSGTFPTGAASVKELLDDHDVVIGFAASRKVGGARYWYEASATQVYADGEGECTCEGCHTRAERDYVFTIAP